MQPNAGSGRLARFSGSVDTAKIDQLIQFALAVAAEAYEHFERRLLPIHLVKYVYLGDLAYGRESLLA